MASQRAWREDLKKVLLLCGSGNQTVGLLISDKTTISEFILEDISTIVNSGDIPGLYSDKEMEEIIASCRGECLKRKLP